MKILKPILSTVFMTGLLISCNDIPLVFDKENTAENLPVPEMPSIDELEVLETLPDPLEFEDGLAYLMKTDILREIMYFSYDPQSLANLYPLYAEDVWDIIRMNRNGERPESLKNDSEPVAPEFVTAVGDDAINRFDEARKRKKKKKSRGGNGGQKKAQAETSAENKPAEQKQPDNQGEKRHNGNKGHKGGNRNGGNRRNDRPKKDTPSE